MPHRIKLALLILVVAANLGATLLFSGAGPVPPSSRTGEAAWDPFLMSVADHLTVPIPTRGIVDVRDVVLPAALGLGLLLVAACAAFGARVERPREPSSTHCVNPAERWILATGGCVCFIAMLSALANASWALSWGWIARFLAGFGWAILIARAFSRDHVRQALTALMGLALISLLLALAHRADRRLAYFQFPIGPVTPTAALASLWAALGVSFAAAAAFHRRANMRAGFFLAVGLLSMYVLHQTGRRGPALGFCAAAVLAGALLVSSLFRGRRVRFATLGVSTAFVLAASAYVIIQARSGDRTRSGPIALRIAYWKTSARLIRDQPSLGAGPDRFIVRMTNALAPRRAEAPSFYHGNIDAYAHNEWIQAAVELGIPGAMFYLALPLGVLWIVRRRVFLGAPRTGTDDGESSDAEPDVAVRATTLALVVGLIDILLIESSNITLRTPIMPVWYWTLLGLAAAMCDRSEPTPAGRISDTWMRLPRSIRAGAALAGTITCFAAVFLDMTASVADADPGAGPRDRLAYRLYAERAIGQWDRAAQRAAAVARARPDAERINDAVARWREMYTLLPGWGDTPARYARALLQAGQSAEAKIVLERALGPELNACEPGANVLYATHFAEDAAEKLRCVQRALRHGAMTQPLKRILTDIAADPATTAILREKLPAARRTASDPDAARAAGGDLELLRIHAFLRFAAGQTDEAIADQRLAAAICAHLEKTSDYFRRGAEAETDIFFTLARMLYEADPANYEAAYGAIVAAERYAVLGIRHERVPDPKPEYGFVVGEVVPAEFPARLRPLWRFSALLKVVSNHTAFLDMRLYWSLPTAQWQDPAALKRELARVYRRAYEDLSRLPPEKRPGHYDALRKTARRFSPHAGAP
ncbi:MAG: O-antigen ligase family protein [Phycisphaerae bacterium]